MIIEWKEKEVNKISHMHFLNPLHSSFAFLEDILVIFLEPMIINKAPLQYFDFQAVMQFYTNGTVHYHNSAPYFTLSKFGRNCRFNHKENNYILFY